MAHQEKITPAVAIARWKPSDRPPSNGVLLIRHGPRHPIDQPLLSAALTKEGIQASVDLGATLRSHAPCAVFSSPVTRCVDTGINIVAGAGWDLAVESSPLLGCPGPFVIPEEGALVEQQVEYAQKHNDWSFLQKHVDGQQMPGMKHRAIGTRDFCQWLRVRLCIANNGYLLCISHDSIIATIAAALSLQLNPWPAPLEGLTLKI